MCVPFSLCAWGVTAIPQQVANPSTPGAGEDVFAASLRLAHRCGWLTKLATVCVAPATLHTTRACFPGQLCGS